MVAMDYVVRDSAGLTQTGTLAGDVDGILSTAGSREVSLNLNTGQVVSYTRVGSNLQVLLADGSTVVLEGFYIGPEKALFLSDNGSLNRVELADAGEGEIPASYVYETAGLEKWGPNDDLVFFDLDRIEPVVAPIAAPLLAGLWPGAAGLAGAGLVAGVAGGGVGGGGNQPVPVEPTVNGGDVVVVGDANGDPADAVAVSGTAEPGSTVAVTLGGTTQDVVANGDGDWNTIFLPGTLPVDGGYDVSVVITEPDGDVIDLAGPSVLIDTTPPDLAVQSGLQSSGHVVNGVDYADGVDISGTGEAGATVMIQVGGLERSTTVSSTGSWSFSFAPGELAEGEYEAGVTFITTDIHGNAQTFTDTIVVDTVAGPIGVNTVAGDDVVNSSEASGGVMINGNSEPGSTVVIEIEGASRTVTVGADGSWSVTFAPGDLPSGEYDTTITATTTDWAGNSASTTHAIHVDTHGAVAIGAPIEGDNIVNQVEASDGVVLTGTAQAGSSVQVSLDGVTHTATVAADGSWSASFAAYEINSGEYDATVTAVATDPSGNVTTANSTVRIDTVAGDVALSAAAIEGDDTINAVERADGVMLTGTATPGLTVEVALGGVTHSVVASANGQWSSLFAAGEIPQGTYDAPISATITDGAGNTRSVSDTVHVDTAVMNLTQITNPIAGDNIINATEAAGGLALDGTVEAGSSVSVMFGSTSRPATVDANGNWSVNFGAGDIPAGESNQAIVVTATDAAGNVDTINSSVRVDTLVNNLALAGEIEGDGVLNAAERDAGLTLNGTVEAGSQVSITVNGITHAANVDANGNWTVDFTAEEIPGGEYTASAQISAIDAAGNMRSITESFVVDTIAEAPVITAYERGFDGVRGISTANAEDFASYDIQQVNADGSATAVSFDAEGPNGRGEMEFDFNNTIPDGSHLVVTAQDHAGNDTGTMFVLDEATTSVVDLSNPGLADFQIEAVDLRFAEDSTLSITAAQLEGLSDHSNDLTVHGGVDDTVSIVGGQATGDTTVIEGQTYHIFTLGDDEGRVMVEDGVTVI